MRQENNFLPLQAFSRGDQLQKHQSTFHKVVIKTTEEDITVKTEVEDNLLTETNTVFDDAPENIEIFDNFKSECGDYTLFTTDIEDYIAMDNCNNK